MRLLAEVTFGSGALAAMDTGALVLSLAGLVAIGVLVLVHVGRRLDRVGVPLTLDGLAAAAALGITTLDKAVRWAQTKSMWPDTFGLACCAIEMMSIVSARYDIARFGMEAFRSSPRQADLLIVSGRVSHKMAAPLRQIYDQMLEPKWVIAMGACASSGGMFNNYAIVQSVDKIVPVDIYVPGCPPRPEQLIEGIIRLHEAVKAGVPPAYEIRSVAS
jgi:NADH-quinone oxidoreductase subunit B